MRPENGSIEGALQVMEGLWWVMDLTICVYANNEVISHGLGLSQLVGVAVMNHVIAVREKHRKNEYECSQGVHYCREKIKDQWKFGNFLDYIICENVKYVLYTGV